MVDLNDCTYKNITNITVNYEESLMNAYIDECFES